jgi:serine-type D-Ala-D-Ala endopeptidase (penicillin-binding protein 7)
MPHPGRVAALLVLMSLGFQAGEAEAKKRRKAAPREKPIAALTREGLPNVQAAGAVVIDLDSGTILYGKNPDASRPIASTSKIFVAMVVRRRGIVLDGVTEITPDDRSLARGGARTRLYEFERYTNIDLLKAMLIASDNRAPSALARAVGLTTEGLIAEMNAMARDLGLKDTSFTDPSGLRGNTSTPRDMAIAMRAFLKDPLLAEIASTRFAAVVAVEAARPKQVNYANTNRLVHSDRNKILAGKTGYTDAARYCLVVASEVGGKKIATVLLGAHGELTRYGDYSRIKGWLTQNAPDAADAPEVPEVPGGSGPGEGVAAPVD